MKNSTIKAYVATIILLGLMSTLSMLPNIYATTVNQGGDLGGIFKAQKMWITQTKYTDPNYANDLHFIMWNAYDNCAINKYWIKISHFTQSNCKRGYQPEPFHTGLLNNPTCPPTNYSDNTMHAIHVNASGVDIPFNTTIMVDAWAWLECSDQIRISDIKWTKDGVDPPKVQPDYGWNIDYPHRAGSVWNHNFTITNCDAAGSFNVTGLMFNSSKTVFELENVTFTGPSYDFALANGTSWSINIQTSTPFYGGGHHYAKFNIVNPTTGEILSQNLIDNPVQGPYSVGGLNVPVDKFGVLAPYIGFASVILGTVLATAIYVKRAKRKK